MMWKGVAASRSPRALACWCLALSVFGLVGALENGVGRLPAMGWSSWNAFRCDISEDLIKVRCMRVQEAAPVS